MNDPVSWAAVRITLSSSQRPVSEAWGRRKAKAFGRQALSLGGFPHFPTIPTIPIRPILSTSKMHRQDLRLTSAPVSLRLLSEELPNMLFQVDLKSKLLLTYSVKFATSTTGWVQLTLPQQLFHVLKMAQQQQHICNLETRTSGWNDLTQHANTQPDCVRSVTKQLRNWCWSCFLSPARSFTQWLVHGDIIERDGMENLSIMFFRSSPPRVAWYFRS